MNGCARVSATVLLVLVPQAASAQLADPGKNDQYVSLFFLRSDQTDKWVGGVASKGDKTLGKPFKMSWQLDYGSLGRKRVSPTGTEATEEASVSKNSGAYTLSYVRRFGSDWRITADGGIEHKRVAPTAPAVDVTHAVDAIAAAAVRHIGSRFLGKNPDPDTAPEIAWSLQAALANADGILSTGEAREFFFDPVAVVWLSLWPATTSSSPTAEPRLFYRVQLRAEAGGMRGFDDEVGGEGHLDGSIVYFFTPANGIMLRWFDGYFDHNLRDRKNATTLNVVWKFK